LTTRKQKNRKGYVIVSVGMNVSLLASIDAAVEEQKANTRGVPLDRSSWIRRAIERDLDHVRRSRRRGQREAAGIDSGGIAEPIGVADSGGPAGGDAAPATADRYERAG
jgi:hypothetical protein